MLERTFFDWVCNKRISSKCISCTLIISKAIKIAEKANDRLPADKRIITQFSDGWLEKFKKKWNLKAYKLHSEAGDIDSESVDSELHAIRAKIGKYALKDVLNCDESGLFYQMEPD